MRKTAAALIMALLITAAAGTFLVRLGKANPILVKPIYAKISIHHPQEKTYNASVVALNLTVETNSDPSLVAISYILDRKVNGTVDQINVTGTAVIYDDQPTWTGDKPTNYYYHPYIEYTLEGNAVLSGLSDGWHNITVYQGSIDDFLFSDTISFAVDMGAEDGIHSALPEVFPVVPVAAASATAVVLCCGLLIYLRKRNGERS